MKIRRFLNETYKFMYLLYQSVNAEQKKYFFYIQTRLVSHGQETGYFN